MYELENEIIRILKKNEIDVVATLPCEKVKVLLKLVNMDPLFRTIHLNKEEDGVGVCAGAFLGGGKPAMIIQSSGIGNLMNALMSLSFTYKLPLPIIASWRGVYKEKISAQIAFNKDITKLFEVYNIPFQTIEDPSEINLVEKVINGAYSSNTPYVALISPKIWGDSSKDDFSQNFPKREQVWSLKYNSKITDGAMTRFEAIKVISEYLDGQVVLSNIGIPSKELYKIKDRSLNFYMLGSYGQVSAIGLGVSLKSKKEVIVLDGDGSLLTSNILPIIAKEKPKNLLIICLDNGTMGSTGDQLTYAYSIIDMELMAISSNIKETKKIHTEKELRSILNDLYYEKSKHLQFLHVIIKPYNSFVEDIPLMPIEIKNRFIEAIKSS